MVLLTRFFRERKLKRVLAGALDAERQRIGPEQTGYIQEFLDEGEFGLAHDQLIDALADLELDPTDRAAAQLLEARRLMHMDKP